jgi:hypothetical protein
MSPDHSSRPADSDPNHTVDCDEPLWWTQGDQIYVHSLVVEYWVEGGLLAALPFIAALGVLGLGLVSALRVRSAIPALVIFLAVQSISDTLFAPETWGRTSLVGLSVGMVLATSFASRDTRQSLSGEVEEPSHSRLKLAVAKGHSHRSLAPAKECVVSCVPLLERRRQRASDPCAR